MSEHVLRGEAQLVAAAASASSSSRTALATQADRLGAACRGAGAQLVLGGAGPWPDPPSYGLRLHSFSELAQLPQPVTI